MKTETTLPAAFDITDVHQIPPTGESVTTAEPTTATAPAVDNSPLDGRWRPITVAVRGGAANLFYRKSRSPEDALSAVKEDKQPVRDEWEKVLTDFKQSPELLAVNRLIEQFNATNAEIANVAAGIPAAEARFAEEVCQGDELVMSEFDVELAHNEITRLKERLKVLHRAIVEAQQKAKLIGMQTDNRELLRIRTAASSKEATLKSRLLEVVGPLLDEIHAAHAAAEAAREINNLASNLVPAIPVLQYPSQANRQTIEQRAGVSATIEPIAGPRW